MDKKNLSAAGEICPKKLGEGSEGLPCPCPTLFLEKGKQLEAGQRWKDGEPLAQGKQQLGIGRHLLQHKANALEMT